MSLEFAATTYRALRDRIRRRSPRSTLATGLKCRISDMQDRLARLQDRAAKRRQIAKDAMVDLNLKKNNSPRFYRVYSARIACFGGAQRGRRAEDLLGARRAKAATPGSGL
jgi:hypothetical protein